MLRLITYARKKPNILPGTEVFYLDRIMKVDECNHDYITLVAEDNFKIRFDFDVTDAFVRENRVETHEEPKMPDKKLESVREKEIEFLSLSRRTLNCLHEENVYAISDLVVLNEKYLRNIKGFGANCLAEVIESLKQHGLELSRD